MNGLFVAGTDTDAGKTVVTAALVRQMRRRGIDAVPMKMVQTGGGSTESGDPVSPDFDLYCTASSFMEAIENRSGIRDMVPLSFVAPCSPHLAARMEGRSCDTGTILAALERLCTRHEWIIAEGVGGINVPLSGSHTTLSLIKAAGLPLVLVIPNALGCINHALNTIQILSAHQVEIRGAVMTQVSPPQAGDSAILEDNPRIIRQLGNIPILGSLPFVGGMACGTEPFWAALDRYMADIVHALFETGTNPQSEPESAHFDSRIIRDEERDHEKY